MEALRLEFISPSPATLKKYGLTLDDYACLVSVQGWVCAICGKPPKGGRFRVDHHHAAGWKKMPPSRRKTFVRGLTCWWCNKTHLGRGITVEKARAVVRYLEAYEERKRRENT